MLRRSPFKSKQPERRPCKTWDGPTPTPRVPALRVVDTRAQIVVPLPKAEPLRSEGYRRFVASFPCFACGIHGHSQAAHPNFGKGLGLKTDDRLCFPLCAVRPGHMGCHQMLDLLIDMTLQQRRASEEDYVERMQKIARNAGRKEFA